MSVTRRNPQEEVEVLIHSQYRNNPSTSNHTNFTYNLNKEIKRVGEIQVSSIQIPFAYYAINDTNHTLHFGGSTPGTANITNGNYTTSTMIVALKAAAESILTSSTVNVTYNSTTNKFTLTSNNQSFSLLATSGANNIAYAIGFETNSANGLTSVSDAVVDLSGPKHLVLKSSVLTQYAAEKNRTATALSTIYIANVGVDNNILHTIPISSQPSGINIDTPLRTSSIRLNTLSSFKNNIDFRIEDDEGNELVLNGKEWSVRLLFKVR